MRFKQRKELADKYREWVKQPIDNNQTMILDCAESVIAFLDINGYLNEVVRCKDCKHYKIDHPRANGYHCCYRMHSIFPMKPDGFCSYGERREQ